MQSVDDSEAALGCLLVERRQVVAGLLHDLDDAVEAHRVATVGESRVEIGVERAGRRIGVAFDAGYLHETAHGVAREAEVMLEAHLGRVFYLGRCAAK